MNSHATFILSLKHNYDSSNIYTCIYIYISTVIIVLQTEYECGVRVHSDRSNLAVCHMALHIYIYIYIALIKHSH